MSRTSLNLNLNLILISLLFSPANADNGNPNILVIWGDDVGQTNISAYTMGLMGYQTPNIDRIAKEGMIFTDYYAEQSCTPAGLASSIRRQNREAITKYSNAL